MEKNSKTRKKNVNETTLPEQWAKMDFVTFEKALRKLDFEGDFKVAYEKIGGKGSAKK